MPMLVRLRVKIWTWPVLMLTFGDWRCNWSHCYRRSRIGWFHFVTTCQYIIKQSAKGLIWVVFGGQLLQHELVVFGLLERPKDRWLRALHHGVGAEYLQLGSLQTLKRNGSRQTQLTIDHFFQVRLIVSIGQKKLIELSLAWLDAPEDGATLVL